MLCRTIGAAAIREASSPAAVMKNRPVNVAATEASSPAAVVKHGPVNVAATEASSPVVLTKQKPMRTAKMAPQKQEAPHKNGTQKAKGQGENANSVTGKICSFLCCVKIGYKNVWHMLQSLPTHRQAQAFIMLCVLCVILYNTVKNLPFVHNIVYIIKHDQQVATLYITVYYCQRCTCFERFLRSSSGAQMCTCSIRYLSNLFAVTASVDELGCQIPDAACTDLSS